MAISINPVLPVLAAQEAGSVALDLVLQPGSVVNAQVLKVLSADLVRIAISSLSIDVLSEIPLQEGQTLQLAVSQTQDGIRLAVVGQGADAAASPADAVTLSSEALGRHGSRSADNHCAAPERVDAARARDRRGGGATCRGRAGKPCALVRQSRRGRRDRQFAAEIAGRRSHRCWRNRPASIKISLAATSRPPFRNPAFPRSFAGVGGCSIERRSGSSRPR